MDYFIETISLIRTDITSDEFEKSVTEYLTPEGISFKGKLTNEGSSKYLMWCLAKEGKLFDRVIMLVTKECVEVPVQAVDGKTTYEYYVASMKEYVKQLSCEFNSIKELLDRNYRGSIDEYVDRTFKRVLISPDPSKKEFGEIAKAIIPDDEKIKEKIDIHIDFTGGSRVASLISLFITRILEAAGSKVKRIVYGSKIDELTRIIDLTKSYDSLLESIEEIANAHMRNSGADILAVFKKLGLATDGDITEAAQIDQINEEISRDLKKKNPDEIKDKKDKLDSLSLNSSGAAGAVKLQYTQKAEENINTSPFIKLKGFNDKKLILNFYEEVFGIFYDLNVFLCNSPGLSAEKQKDLIKNSVRANDNYYKGVLQKVKKWLDQLSKPHYSKTQSKQYYYKPQETFEYKTKITAKEYASVASQKYVTALSEKHSDIFKAYFTQSNTVAESVSPKEHARLQRIYFNCGFPFMCMGVGLNSSEPYPEITDYYLKKVERLFSSLEELRSNNIKRYVERLNKLLKSPAALEAEIPYMIKTSVWEANGDKFNSDDDKKEFIKTLCDRIEKVRPYRNAISHKLDNEYSKLSAQKAMTAEIRKWLDEYENTYGKT